MGMLGPLMRKSVALSVIVLLLVACGDAYDPELARVLKSHTEAVGGAEAIENVHSLQIDLQIEELTFSVNGSYLATRDGRVRIDIFADRERVFTEAYDGTAGWQLLKGRSIAEDMSPEGEQAVIHGIHGNIFGLHELEGLGYEFDLEGKEMIDDTEYWVVDSESSTGFHKRYYINAETFLIERTREESALHPDVDPEIKRFETLHSDYLEISDRMFSFSTKKINMDSGEVVQSTEVVRLVVNPKIDPTIFDRPTH